MHIKDSIYRRGYTQRRVHTEEKRIHIEESTHRGKYRQEKVYTEENTQRRVHTIKCTYRGLYIW